MDIFEISPILLYFFFNKFLQSWTNLISLVEMITIVLFLRLSNKFVTNLKPSYCCFMELNVLVLLVENFYILWFTFYLWEKFKREVSFLLRLWRRYWWPMKDSVWPERCYKTDFSTFPNFGLYFLSFLFVFSGQLWWQYN